ncbi:MAG: flagellar basal body P-ring protein FlgI, partial [Candidatus Hydrogenedentota bacterium]
MRTRQILIVFLALSSAAVHAARVKDLCEVQGVRGNALKGIGLVVGLAGTGDKAAAAIRAQERVLTRLTIEVGSAAELASSNVAVVYVTATLPPFAKEGTRIDISVHSAYDAKSLQGGTLMETLLYGADDQVYAVAQGPLSIGGFEADGGGGNTVRTNHVTSGRVPMGAYVEHEVPSTITDGQRIILLLKRPDFSAASSIVQAVNTKYGDS